MKENTNTLFSSAYELTERSDGSKQPRLKQDTELRALLEGHTADEPGYEMVVMFALFDASTPKGAQMNIKDEQEQFPDIVLDSYPCPDKAESWLRFAEEKKLRCLDTLYAWMADRYENGVELICPENTSYNAVVSAEKTQNLLSSAAANHPNAMFQLYRMISGGKYQQQKRLLLKLVQFVPFVLLIPIAKCFSRIAENAFFYSSFSRLLYDERSLILHLIGFAVSLCIYFVLFSKITSVVEQFNHTLKTQKSELLCRAAELGSLDAQYELTMQRPAGERDLAFAECLSYAKQGCNTALETLLSWYQEGSGTPELRDEADSFLHSEHVPQERFAQSHDQQLACLEKAASLNSKYRAQYGRELLWIDAKKATEVLKKGAEDGDSECMRLLSHRRTSFLKFAVMMTLCFIGLYLTLSDPVLQGAIEEMLSAEHLILSGIIALAFLLAVTRFWSFIAWFAAITPPRSRYWRKRAAEAGNAEALYEINEFVFRRTVQRQNYIKSAEAGYGPAMGWLSKRYERGSRKYKIEKDPHKAFYWAEKMSKTESADGLARLAYCYERGVGVEKNLAKAAQLYFLGQSFGTGNSVFLNHRLLLLQLLGHLDPLYIGMRELEHEQDIGKTLQEIFTGIQSGDSRRVTDALKDLSARTISLKKQLTEQAEQFLDYCENMTKETIHTAEQDVTNYEKAEGELKQYFGDDWDRLTEQCRIALISARCLLSATSEYDAYDFDYSGVSITATSALEGELKRYFLDGPKACFRKEFGTQYSRWPKPFVYIKNDGTRQEIDRFELGMLRFLLNIPSNEDNYTKENGAVLTNYLRTIVKPEFYQKVPVYLCFKNPVTICGIKQVYGLLDLVNRIRENYRNPSAHASKVSRMDAEACCHAVIGYTEAKDNVSNAEAALRVLLYIVR